MKRQCVFIGWSGEDNQEIARRVSALLREEGYSSIVGGEWRKAFTVSEEIIHQMNGCDFAIFLIEKEVRKDGDNLISMGFNANVMMEMGYMLRRVSDHNRIRRMLINVRPHELPSDLQGVWTDEIKKDSYPENDTEAKNAMILKVANEIAERFFNYMNDFKNVDKLDYLDNWEENKFDIYNFTGDVRIGEALIYGMQAAIYTGDFDRLYECLGKVKEALVKRDHFKDYGVVTCALAILNVFVVTRRLTVKLTDSQFSELFEALEYEHEKDVADKDLKKWCAIFRKDKQELCYEFCAESQESDEEKIEYYYEALRLCHETINMIEEHINSSDRENSSASNDANYALIYKGFANRNISQIHKKLIALEPEKAEEHRELQKKYCAETYKNRKELYSYYKNGLRENAITMDFVSQEYFLALAEQYEFEESAIERKRIKNAAQTIQKRLEDRAKVHNMILQAVKNQNADFS